MILYTLYMSFTYLVGLLVAGYIWGLTGGMTKCDFPEIPQTNWKPIFVFGVMASPLLITISIFILSLFSISALIFVCIFELIKLVSRMFIFEDV